MNKTPDKIYLGIQELGSGYTYDLSLDNNGEQEYIRKDLVDETVKTAEDHAYFAGQEKFREKMLEWAKEMKRICKGAEPIEKTYQTMIDKIELL